jgi:Predicted hydrolases or acyltransferases (alpha/beta hydrolase superfamily)
MSNFLLIHGGSQGGWVWEKVKKILESDGHFVLAPDLPGHETNSVLSAKEVTMDKYVNSVVDIIRNAGSRLNVIGHSLGAAVVTKAVDVIKAENIDKLFYVSGLLPQNGDSIRELLRGDVNSDFKKTIKLDHERMATEVIPEMLDEILFNGCSKKDIHYAKNEISPATNNSVRNPNILFWGLLC